MSLSSQPFGASAPLFDGIILAPVHTDTATVLCSSSPYSIARMGVAVLSLYAETAKRAALHFVHTSDIPSEHKAVILEALREALANDRSASASASEERVWTDTEETQMRTFLENKSARGWQHADELAMALGIRLHRPASEIRRKAVEMGFGVSIDYSLARWASQRSTP